MSPPMLLLPRSEPYYSSRIAQKYRLDSVAGCSSSTAQASRRAKIEFIPNKKEFLARRAQRILAGGLETQVPTGWPTVVGGRMAWKGKQFLAEDEFVYRLTDTDKFEIDRALMHFRDLGLDGEEVSQANFPLPTFGVRLAEIREEIYYGLGAMILRGLEVNKYTPADLVLVFLGVSSHIAERRGLQDRDCNVIKHVIDGDRKESQVELPLHTDVTCDIVATLTRLCSTMGGEGTIASISTIYNELAAVRPDLIHVLSKPDWPHDTYGRQPPYYNRALLHQAEDRVVLNFSRRILTGHMDIEPRSPNIPNLTEAQAEALDAVHFAAKEVQMKLSMEEGDMKFINNMGLLHGRDAFFDDDQCSLSRRHLIRLWLNNKEKMWKLPTQLQIVWDRVFDDEERIGRWDIEPVRIPGVRTRTRSPCD